MTLSLEDIAKHIKALPSLPEAVFEVLDSLEQDTMSVAHLAGKVSLDSSLTVEILRLANSPYYNTSSRVTTVQQGINLIGLSGVRNLVLAVALKGYFQDCPCEGFDFNAFWRHSLATAVCAKALARKLQLNQDYAYTAGLLHDIGRLVLVRYFTREYEQVIAWRAEKDCHILEAEHAVLGADHAMVGEALARQWHLPKGIQNAIAQHHAPDVTNAKALTAIVHVSDAVAHALDLSNDEDDLVPPLSTAAWNALELGENAWLRIFRETEMEFEAVQMGFVV